MAQTSHRRGTRHTSTHQTTPKWNQPHKLHNRGMHTHSHTSREQAPQATAKAEVHIPHRQQKPNTTLRQTSISRSTTPAFPLPTRQNLPTHDAKRSRSRSNRSTRAQPRRHIRDLGRLGLHAHPQRLTGRQQGRRTTHTRRHTQSDNLPPYHTATRLAPFPPGRLCVCVFGVSTRAYPSKHPSIYSTNHAQPYPQAFTRPPILLLSIPYSHPPYLPPALGAWRLADAAPHTTCRVELGV
jgi:hypothetical protein